jgi:thioredoxin-like negative regulator of GroEL
MIVDINGYKEFNKYIVNKINNIIIVYFYTQESWCSNLNHILFPIFKDNNNGNVIFLTVNVDLHANHEILAKTDVTNYPIVRLYKEGNMFQEIYCTYPNISSIIKSLIN